LETYIQTGQVRYIYRHFPLDSHAQAQAAGEAAECAGAQGAFWPMHEALFESQEQWSGNARAEELFAGLAEELGLDRDEFERCLASGEYAAKVEVDFQEGVAQSVTGTPAFFINGVSISGAQPFAAFQEQIDYFLAGGEPPSKEVSADSYRSLGEADAPVVVTEFSDYQCPACASVEREMVPALIEQYVETGKVRFVYREFPLSSIHPNAQKASEAAICAGKQDRYWEMHDRLFENQAEWQGEADPSAVFRVYAQELDLDTAMFDQCLDSGEAAVVVRGDLLAGQAMGVNATPYFFVNDLPIRGGLPIETLGQVIDYVAAGGETPQIVPAGSDWHLLGNPQSASAITVAFVDYSNPESAEHAAQVLPRLQEAYVDTGDMAYVLHPWFDVGDGAGAQGAIAAECAGTQGQYWGMHDQLFANQASWTAAPDPASQFSSYAEALGMDVGSFEDCLESEDAALQAQAGKIVSILYGVPGAPVFLFNNGQGQQGSPSFEEFEQIIDSIIGR
jgi:protein-disulfide isomerase